MPLFDYQCRDCGEHFEALLFSGDPEPACPACQSRNTARDFIGRRAFTCPGNGGTCSGSCESCHGCHH